MTKLKITNLIDSVNAQRGLMAADQVRTLEREALVDTGATMLVLPAEICSALGLVIGGHRSVCYADGRVERVPWVKGVQIEILGREMTTDALVVAAGTTPLIGQIPLEALDLIVDPKTREARVNPRSPDIPLLDLFLTAA